MSLYIETVRIVRTVALCDGTDDGIFAELDEPGIRNSEQNERMAVSEQENSGKICLGR